VKFFILFLIAMLISSIGFKRFVWFISIGYGFSIAGAGLAIIAMFCRNLNIVSLIMCLLFVIYGCRLGGYLLIREKRSSSYQATMKNDIKDGSGMHFFLKIIVWVTCSLLYCCEVSPVFFRLENQAGTDALTVIGCIVMAAGIGLEAFADYTKNQYKKQHPKRFCDVGVFKFVRCPNYLGEVLTWTGVFLSGAAALQGALQWISALYGWICIVYIMFGGARRLEIRQNKNYGEDPEYQHYVKTTPILIPFIPLYSVEKYKWLVG
jgi:steroid 5-alpha reductase family enzyme